MDPQLAALSADLLRTAGNNTLGFVETRIKEARTKKTIEEVNLVYSELVNGLLKDKQDLERIAYQYQDLYESVTISDEDIIYLQNTLQSVLDLLSEFVPQAEENAQSIEMVIKLLNKDTLKTMQLLGFNYKEAIGRPLTNLVASMIESKMPQQQKTNRKK
ncbi:hypothetical protein [Enterococcus gallinarum]|uniref:hypothetical protein n=1 Tax=Enterococcus gallinarum TaxID=1353 RepID=UPI0020549C2A|nr:MAG TPA: hypothetical protein [Caudoviricetes sp.]